MHDYLEEKKRHRRKSSDAQEPKDKKAEVYNNHLIIRLLLLQLQRTLKGNNNLNKLRENNKVLILNLIISQLKPNQLQL